MEFNKSSYTIGELANAVIFRKMNKRNKSMEELPKVNNQNRSLEVRKPWYYHDRNVSILNCKCPFHKKRVIAHQYIQYQFNHSKGCHNQMIRIQKVKIHNYVRDQTNQLLKAEYNRRQYDLESKREKIRVERKIQESRAFLRKSLQTATDGFSSKPPNSVRKYFRSMNKDSLRSNTAMIGNGKQNKADLFEKNVLLLKQSNQIQSQNAKQQQLIKKSSKKQKQNRNQQQNECQNSGQNESQNEYKSGLQSQVRNEQLLKKSSVKGINPSIKQMLSDPTTKHYSTLQNLRRRGYNFQGFPEVQKYLDCIQRQFRTMIQTNGTQAFQKNIFMKQAQKKLREQFSEINSQMAGSLIQSWMEKGSMVLLRAIKRQSGDRQISKESQRNISNSKKRSTVNSDFGPSFSMFGKRNLEEGWKQNNKQNKDGLKSYIQSSKMSRRSSLASKMSSNFISSITSNIIKSHKDDRNYSSSSRLGLNSKLRVTNRPDVNPKKKPPKPTNKKSNVSQQKPEPYISGTALADDQLDQQQSQVLELKSGVQTQTRKYIKPVSLKRRLTTFKNSHSQLLFNNERTELLKQLSGFRDTKKQMSNSIQSNLNPYDMVIKKTRSIQIIDPNQLNIGHLVIRGHKRPNKITWKDQYILNQYEEQDEEDSEDQNGKQQQLIKQLKILRKKRIKMNLINHILFGDAAGDAEDHSLSDVQGYGSSTNLNSYKGGCKKRNSEQIVPRYASARLRANGPKSPLVRFYDLKRDQIQDQILQNINDLLMKSNLSHLCINMDDSKRIRSRKVKKIKQYLYSHPQIYAKDLIRNIKLFQEHQKLTKATKVAAKLNYDPELLLSLNIPDDTIIKAILNIQSKKISNPGFGYELKEIDPHQSSSASMSLSDEQNNIKQKVKGSVIPNFKQLDESNYTVEREEDIFQRGLIQHSSIENYFMLDHYFRESVLQMQSLNPHLATLPTQKIIERIQKQKQIGV